MTFAFMGMTRSPSTEREGRTEPDIGFRPTSQYIRDNRVKILKILGNTENLSKNLSKSPKES